jgi:hypothetical protein
MTTPTSKRDALLRRIELRKREGRKIPHKLRVELQKATEAELARSARRDWIRVQANGGRNEIPR